MQTQFSLPQLNPVSQDIILLVDLTSQLTDVP